MLLVTTRPSLTIGTVLWMGLGSPSLRALLGRGSLFTKLVGDAVPKENAKLSHERGMLVPLCLAHLARCCTSSLVFRVSVDLAQRACLFMASAAVAGVVDLGEVGRASCTV